MLELQDESTVEDSMGHFKGSEYDLVCVNKVLDIEENIWSPMFGLKGKIDASVQVLLGTSKRNPALDPRTLTVPFELKTGRMSNVTSHRAQTMLYTLLMTDRYGKMKCCSCRKKRGGGVHVKDNVKDRDEFNLTPLNEH